MSYINALNSRFSFRTSSELYNTESSISKQARQKDQLAVFCFRNVAVYEIVWQHLQVSANYKHCTCIKAARLFQELTFLK